MKHDGIGKRCFDMKNKGKIFEEITFTIFQTRKNSQNEKDIHDTLKVWFKIILGCIHHRSQTNSFDFINTDKKYMSYYISTSQKINLPSILFKYMREMVRETRDGRNKMRNLIPLGRLISNVLIERNLVGTLRSWVLLVSYSPLLESISIEEI